MQAVSETYKRSMRSPLRERGYIRVKFKIYDKQAQSAVGFGSMRVTTYFSAAEEDVLRGRKRPSEIPDSQIRQYATLENEYTTVDGEMRFLPEDGVMGSHPLDKYMVFQGFVSETEVLTFRLEFPAPQSFKGITIDFGENYPVRFSCSQNGEKNIYVDGNTESVWHTEEVFDNTEYIEMSFYKMKHDDTRLRILSIRLGYELLYDNNSVLSSSLESYVSPISEDVPQTDFSVTLTNYDRYFNVDNPESVINYLRTGQETEIAYGYQLPDGGKIEWVNGGKLLCAEWDADDSSATIRCQDILRNLDQTCYRGQVVQRKGEPPVTYDRLAAQVFNDAGITEYELDPFLATLSTFNPIPVVSHKEALQIIANAACCRLLQTRDGKIRIQSTLPRAVPQVQFEMAASYATPENIVDASKQIYEGASLAQDYTTVDGKMRFLSEPDSYHRITALFPTGAVSNDLWYGYSDASGEFKPDPDGRRTGPVIDFTFGMARSCSAITLEFGNALPGEIVVTAENNAPITVTNGITKCCVIRHDFAPFARLSISFPCTAKPYNRIVLNHVYLDETSDCPLTRTDMLSSPKVTRAEQVKEVIVPWYGYYARPDPETGLFKDERLIQQEIKGRDLKRANGVTLYSQEPFDFANDHVTVSTDAEVKDPVATVADAQPRILKADCHTFYITVTCKDGADTSVLKDDETYYLNVYGLRYDVTEQTVTVALHDTGKSVRWENPLISDRESAERLANWLAGYYSSDLEYEYDTRGNPELEAGDTIFQENDFIDEMRVEVCQCEIGFAQSFSGHVVTKRKGG